MTISFLLEGIREPQSKYGNLGLQLTFTILPELQYAHQMASLNKWPVMDIIISRDKNHYKYAFSKFPKDQHERLVHCFIDNSRSSFTSDEMQQAIEDIIIPAYLEVDNTLPQWLKNLQKKSFAQTDQQKKEMNSKIYTKQKGFQNPNDGYEQDKAKIDKWFENTSNSLSVTELNNYLTKNPNITTIFGLVGATHLSITNKLANCTYDDIIVPILGTDQAIPAGKNIKYPFGQRIIEIILFGGTHGNLAAYHFLSRYLVNKGYVIPNLSDAHQQQLNMHINSYINLFEFPDAPAKVMTPQFTQSLVQNKSTTTISTTIPEQHSKPSGLNCLL